MADHLSERDELTLRTLAIIDGTTLAEQRRIGLAAYATQARKDPDVAEIVRLILHSRWESQDDGSNVIRMEGRRD